LREKSSWLPAATLGFTLLLVDAHVSTISAFVGGHVALLRPCEDQNDSKQGKLCFHI
jgi:hypothetical protein